MALSIQLKRRDITGTTKGHMTLVLDALWEEGGRSFRGSSNSNSEQVINPELALH